MSRIAAERRPSKGGNRRGVCGTMLLAVRMCQLRVLEHEKRLQIPCDLNDFRIIARDGHEDAMLERGKSDLKT